MTVFAGTEFGLFVFGTPTGAKYDSSCVFVTWGYSDCTAVMLSNAALPQATVNLSVFGLDVLIMYMIALLHFKHNFFAI